MYIILGQQRIMRAGASYFDIDAYLCIIIRNRVSNARVYGLASFVGILLSLVACDYTWSMLNCNGEFLGKDCSSAEIATCLGVLNYCRLKRAPLSSSLC